MTFHQHPKGFETFTLRVKLLRGVHELVRRSVVRAIDIACPKRNGLQPTWQGLGRNYSDFRGSTLPITDQIDGQLIGANFALGSSCFVASFYFQRFGQCDRVSQQSRAITASKLRGSACVT